MQFPKEVLNCIAFLGYTDKEGEKHIAGTGFFMSKGLDNEKLSVIYLITALHNVTEAEKIGLNEIEIRVNTKEGVVWISLPIDEFKSHPEHAVGNDCIDVVAARIRLDSDIDCTSLNIRLFATDEIIENEQIGLGDEIAIVGLFRSHYGKQKNEPVVRIGNICAVPIEKVETDMGNMQAYLVEARSIGGISGSPVFVHLEAMRGKFETKTDGDQFIIATNYYNRHQKTAFYCIGLVHGHYDIKELTGDAFIEDFGNNKKERVNMGVAIVIPSTKIIETINQSYFLDLESQNQKNEC